MDREKKIAEIRERHGRRNENGQRFAIFQGHAADDIFFLLSELDRAEKELELFDQRGETIERQLNIIEQLQEESRKLREEREKLIEGLRYLMKELGKLSVKPENGTAIHAYKKMRNILKEIGVAGDV